MDKYTLIVVLNTPFIIFGLLRAYVSYKTKVIKFGGLLLRIGFWLVIFCGLVFARAIYNFLVTHNLTDSAPLSIADVVQTTGVIFCLSLILRLYAKNEATEQQFNKLHQELSIILSEKGKNI